MLKRKCAGSYYYENAGNEVMFGTSDWEKINIYKINYKTWGYCVDKGMTKAIFSTLSELRSHLDV